MSDNFELAVKSTLDKILKDDQAALVAAWPTLGGAELDDTVETNSTFGSPKPNLFWQWRTLNPECGETLYSASFLIGVKTTDDKGNYDLAAILSALLARHSIGDDITLRDYSGVAEPYPEVGVMTLIGKDVDPQQFDKQSGMRYAQIHAKVARWPT